jgi:hypothetical protein
LFASNKNIRKLGRLNDEHSRHISGILEIYMNQDNKGQPQQGTDKPVQQQGQQPSQKPGQQQTQQPGQKPGQDANKS